MAGARKRGWRAHAHEAAFLFKVLDELERVGLETSRKQRHAPFHELWQVDGLPLKSLRLVDRRGEDGAVAACLAVVSGCVVAGEGEGVAEGGDARLVRAADAAFDSSGELEQPRDRALSVLRRA